MAFFLAKRYVKYLRRIILLSFLSWIQYPLDVLMSGVGSIFYTIMQLSLFYFLFQTSASGTLGAVHFQDFYLVFVCTEWSMVLFFFFTWDNVLHLQTGIEHFFLDSALIKPLPAFLLLQFPKVGLSETVPVLFILICLHLGFFIIGLPPSLHLLHVPLLALWIILGFLLFHFVNLWCVSVQFYIPGFHGLWKFLRETSNLVQYPRTLFPSPIQWFFLFFFPYFLLSDPLYTLLSGNLTLAYVLEHFIFSVLYCSLSSIFWARGLRRYGT